MLLLGRERWKEAEFAFREAIDLGQGLSTEFGAILDYRMTLAKSYFYLGLCLNEQANPQAAEEAYRKGISVRKQREDANSEVPRHQIDLASGYNNLGAILSGQRRLAEAKKVYELAIALQEKVVRRDASEVAVEYRINLAGTSSNLANVVRNQGKPRDALPWYNKAIALLTTAHAQNPQLPSARRFLRNASWDRANALGQIHEHAAAIKDWQRAIDLDEGPDHDALQLFLATAQEELKLKKLVDPPNPAAAAGLYFDAARLHARVSTAALSKKDTSLQEQYVRRALELLKQAKSTGFFSDSSRRLQLKNDPVFHSLRDGPDFRKFIEELD
jgi:tetratricopeptide (TPR) repeat protein